jgi:hypothetical protein
MLAHFHHGLTRPQIMDHRDGIYVCIIQYRVNLRFRLTTYHIYTFLHKYKSLGIYVLCHEIF